MTDPGDPGLLREYEENYIMKAIECCRKSRAFIASELAVPPYWNKRMWRCCSQRVTFYNVVPFLYFTSFLYYILLFVDVFWGIPERFDGRMLWALSQTTDTAFSQMDAWLDHDRARNHNSRSPLVENMKRTWGQMKLFIVVIGLAMLMPEAFCIHPWAQYRWPDEVLYFCEKAGWEEQGNKIYNYKERILHILRINLDVLLQRSVYSIAVLVNGLCKLFILWLYKSELVPIVEDEDEEFKDYITAYKNAWTQNEEDNDVARCNIYIGRNHPCVD